MLSVHITTRNAQLLDGEEQIYQYTGDRYEDDARFWLNDAGLLTKYEWAMSEGSHWRVELEKPSLSKLNVDWL